MLMQPNMPETRPGKPARLVVVSQIPPPHHGSTMMTLVFLEMLDELSVEFKLIDRRFSKKLGDIGRFSAAKMARAFGLLSRLIKMQIEWKPTGYVLFITNRPASFLVDWALTELMRAFQRPIINYVHTSGFTALANRNRIFRILVKRSLSSAHTTVCLGDSLVADVSWATTGNIVTIPNTPHALPSSSSSAEARSSVPTFLFLSNLIPEKGAKDFIEAAIDVCSTHAEVKFVVAGATPDAATLKELTDQVQASPWHRRITFVGRADEKMKWRLLQSSYSLVFPSTYAFEAQPLSIVEAMSTGLPVIAYDTGGIRDLVTDDVTGYLLAPNDRQSLRMSMTKLLDDESLAAGLGKNALAKYNKTFSLAAYQSAWSRVLSQSRFLG